MSSLWRFADDNRTDRLRAILRRCNERPDGFGARIKGKAGRASASSACRWRSAQAVRLLREAGFENVFNLEGGIAKWSDEIDPDVPKY